MGFLESSMFVLVFLFLMIVIMVGVKYLVVGVYFN